MASKRIRIILDTNWYISATISKKSRRALYELLTDKNLTIIYCIELLNEYKQVISREKFNKIITKEQYSRFMNLVISKLEIIDIKSDIQRSRDPKDNFLLSLSLDSNAAYLITGDVDLLILEKIGSTQIITLNSFLEITSR